MDVQWMIQHCLKPKNLESCAQCIVHEVSRKIVQFSLLESGHEQLERFGNELFAILELELAKESQLSIETQCIHWMHFMFCACNLASARKSIFTLLDKPVEEYRLRAYAVALLVRIRKMPMEDVDLILQQRSMNEKMASTLLDHPPRAIHPFWRPTTRTPRVNRPAPMDFPTKREAPKAWQTGIPYDVLGAVLFPYLNFRDLIHARAVCTEWRIAEKQHSTFLWKALVKHFWPDYICRCEREHQFEQIFSMRIRRFQPSFREYQQSQRSRNGKKRFDRNPQVDYMRHLTRLSSKLMCKHCQCVTLFDTRDQRRIHLESQHPGSE